MASQVTSKRRWLSRKDDLAVHFKYEIKQDTWTEYIDFGSREVVGYRWYFWETTEGGRLVITRNAHGQVEADTKYSTPVFGSDYRQGNEKTERSAHTAMVRRMKKYRKTVLKYSARFNNPKIIGERTIK